MTETVAETVAETNLADNKFMVITNKLLDIAEELREINPTMGNMFGDLITTYFAIINDLVINDKADYNSFQIRTKLFERIFDYNFNDEFEILIKDYFDNQNGVINGSDSNKCEVDGSDGSNKDRDINNVDEDILANIKKNIQSYLD